MKTRREFLAVAGLGLAGAAASPEAALNLSGMEFEEMNQAPTQEPAGMPPAFGTAKPVGPVVAPETFSEAQKLVQIENSPKDLKQVAQSWRVNMAPLYEMRTGPRKMELPDGLAPWSRWDPILPGTKAGPERNQVIRSKSDAIALPAKRRRHCVCTGHAAFALDRDEKAHSERLTNIYLTRFEQFNPTLHCVITLTKEHALAQAKTGRRGNCGGKYRGPLHGIPWGGKDLLDTAGIRDDLRRRTLSQPRAHRRCGRGANA